jgi:hypothetical protein
VSRPTRPGTKRSSRTPPAWEHFERLIARLAADELSTDYCVTPNARIAGRISGRSRQIDVLIDLRHDTDNSRRVIIDAKKRKRKIDVTDVEQFRGLMEDTAATHGYLVCPKGFTKAAERRAQSVVSLRLIPPDRLHNFDPASWPKCEVPTCKHGRVFWDGYPEITARLAPLSNPTLPARLISFIHYVGKCDRCMRFYVKCITCGDLISVPEDDDNDYGHRCGCKLPWFWLASVESDEHGIQSAELHAVLPTGKVITADRRALQ